MIQTCGVDFGLNIINENSVIYFNFVYLTVLYTNALVNDLEHWQKVLKSLTGNELFLIIIVS